MEQFKGYEYLVNGHEDEELFAKGILVLVNHKCSVPNSVIDVRTTHGSNAVEVITYVECDSFIERTMGKIEMKSEIEIVEYLPEDLKVKCLNVLDKLENDYLSKGKGYHVIFDFKSL